MRAIQSRLEKRKSEIMRGGRWGKDKRRRGRRKVLHNVSEAIRRGGRRLCRELENRNESMKLQNGKRDVSRNSRRAYSRKEIRIGAVGNQSGIVNEKKKDFERVRGTKKVIT